MEKNINVILEELNKLETEKKKLENELQELKNETGLLVQEFQVVRQEILSEEEINVIAQKIYANQTPIKEKEALIKENASQIEKWSQLKKNAIEELININNNQLPELTKKLNEIEQQIEKIKLSEPNSYAIDVLENEKKSLKEKLDKLNKEKEQYFNLDLETKEKEDNPVTEEGLAAIEKAIKTEPKQEQAPVNNEVSNDEPVNMEELAAIEKAIETEPKQEQAPVNNEVSNDEPVNMEELAAIEKAIETEPKQEQEPVNNENSKDEPISEKQEEAAEGRKKVSLIARINEYLKKKIDTIEAQKKSGINHILELYPVYNIPDNIIKEEQELSEEKPKSRS